MKQRAYHYSFKHFIDNGRQYSLIIISAKVCVYLGESVRHGAEQDTQRDVDILEICDSQQEDTKVRSFANPKSLPLSILQVVHALCMPRT